MGRSRSADPDGYLDADRGSSSDPTSKRAELLGAATASERAGTRDGARELDVAVESMPGLTRQQRDRERAMPRPTPGLVPHPAMERTLPAPDAVRTPLSSRQRKARSIAKHTAQERLPATQYTATVNLVGQPERWRRINDALSEATGDVQVLEDEQRREVQRVDRAIQTFERANDRGHVVYSNVEMPTTINSAHLEAFVRKHFAVGTTVHFDRFTMTNHTLHETEPRAGAQDRTAVFEIQTRRGAYLGASDGRDDTSHLLPRGMRFTVAGAHPASYRRPDGTHGTRTVIQLIDTATT